MTLSLIKRYAGTQGRAWLLAAAVAAVPLGAIAPTAPAQPADPAAAADPSTASADVKVSQVGYLPDESKFAMLTAAPSGDVVVRDAANDQPVLTVPVLDAVTDADSGDTIHAVDFSKLTSPGTYYVDAPGVGQSYRFTVADDAFAHAFRLAMRSFTGQRCGTDVTLAPDFPQYHYAACHVEDAVYHASSGKEGTRDIRGGWHDAGDYGRYIVNSGITTGTLLWTYELNADQLQDLNLDLPESGDATPDFLDEVKWNIDWMLKMQDHDGGVWHKSTTANFPGFVMPKDDTAPTLIIGSGQEPYKTTEATADFAAVTAAAARIYKPFNEEFAAKNLAAAEKAWAWVQEHPDKHYRRNPEGIGTGGYGGGDARDEILWAAAELFRTTGDDKYNQYFLENYTQWEPTIQHDSPQGWPDVRHMAMYTYALSEQEGTNAEARQKIRQDAIAAADQIVERASRNGYRIPMNSNQYFWGSNSVVANYAMMLWLANRFEPKPAYVNAAQDALHYLVGRNTFNTSYVTQVGTKWAMNPHHRPSGADEIEQPWPGLIVGGPNAQSGRRRRNAEGQEAPPPPPPARAWQDETGSYTTNENAINWNAPLVFILAETLPE